MLSFDCIKILELESHQWQILGIIALILLETVLVIQLLINRARRKKAEKELLDLNAELENKVRQVWV